VTDQKVRAGRGKVLGRELWAARRLVQGAIAVHFDVHFQPGAMRSCAAQTQVGADLESRGRRRLLPKIWNANAGRGGHWGFRPNRRNRIAASGVILRKLAQAAGVEIDVAYRTDEDLGRPGDG